jgi:hypothetical protein
MKTKELFQTSVNQTVKKEDWTKGLFLRMGNRSDGNSHPENIGSDFVMKTSRPIEEAG